MPAYPGLARQEGAQGSALVEVRLDASSGVTRSEVRRSSGNNALDRAAQQAATATTYVPAIFDCRPDAGTYLFHAMFVDR